MNIESLLLKKISKDFRIVKIISAIILLSVFVLESSLVYSASSDKDKKVEDKYSSLETLARGMFYIERMYVDADKVQYPSLVSSALTGMVSKLDPHTVILSKEAFSQLTGDTKGKFGGVGMIVSQEKDRIIIVAPIEDTPAYKAGIQSMDEIVAIDGLDIKNLQMKDISDHLRGDPGTKLKLRINRKGKLLDFELKREIIKVKSVKSTLLAEGIVYIKVTNFQDSTFSEISAVLDQNKNNIKGLIIDLRDNPGGLLDQSVKVSDLFIDNGLIVSTIGRGKERVEREFAHKKNTYSNFPITVLVNGGSASASEIVTGALQDHKRAVVVGTKSFGKGSVQTLLSLPDGSGLKLTVARYYTPSGRSIQDKGISPDVVVDPENKEISLLDVSIQKKIDGYLKYKNEGDKNNIYDSIQSDIDRWDASFKKDNQIFYAFLFVKENNKLKNKFN